MPLAIAILSAFAVLSGCERQWHFSITGGQATLEPQFCVSKKVDCRGGGVDLGQFFVYRVNEDTGAYTPVWEIEPSENVPLHLFTYGRPPQGWTATEPAHPLEVGALYSVGKYFFRIHSSEGGLRYEVFSEMKK